MFKRICAVTFALLAICFAVAWTVHAADLRQIPGDDLQLHLKEGLPPNFIVVGRQLWRVEITHGRTFWAHAEVGQKLIQINDNHWDFAEAILHEAGHGMLGLDLNAETIGGHQCVWLDTEVILRLERDNPDLYRYIITHPWKEPKIKPNF